VHVASDAHLARYTLHVETFTKNSAYVLTTMTWLLVVSSAMIFVSACGRVVEGTQSPSSEADADASSPFGLPPDEPSSPVHDAGDPFGAKGCATSPRPRAGSIDGGASLTTFVELHADGDAGAARTLHSPYETGSFAAGASAQSPSAVCGDRGVYFADTDCGSIAFAGCEEESDGGAARSCIYFETNIYLRADERMTIPAGHFVDGTGRCWELLDAEAVLGLEDVALGESQSGTFEATAVSGAERIRLSGSFVACRAVTYNHTCK
jgi:hypothetical protein